jgi:hypothetical protein
MATHFFYDEPNYVVQNSSLLPPNPGITQMPLPSPFLPPLLSLPSLTPPLLLPPQLQR